MGAWYIAAGLYSVLCVLYVELGLKTRVKLLRLVLKCLPILFLITWILSYMFTAVNSGKTEVPLTSKHNESGKVAKLTPLIWALTFSVIGDGFLVFPKVFPIGLLSFGISQCVYIHLFGVTVVTLLDVSWLGWATFTLVGLMASTFVFYFHQKIQHVVSLPRTILGCVYVYFTLLSLMLWSTLLRFQVEFDLSSFVGIVGGALFYVSDILIAVTAVWKVQLLHWREMIMITYYSAQFCLALSFLNIL